MHLGITSFVSAWLSSLLLASAQEGGAVPGEPNPPVAEISVVAFGPKPERKYKHVEGVDVPVMLLAKPGETPPPRLYYQAKEKGDKKVTWKAFNVPFNNPSVMRAVPADKELQLFLKQPRHGEYKRYVKIPAGKEGSQRIFFLTPAVKGSIPWATAPRVSMISLHQANVRGKHFILKNLSRFTVLHAFNDSVVSVEPSEMISYERHKASQLYRLAARYGSHKKVIYNTAVRLHDDGHIHLYVMYDANPKTNLGRSVGVFRMMIPARRSPQSIKPLITETP